MLIFAFFGSWDAIRRTANVTDLELGERFKRTAMYSVLYWVISHQFQRPGCDLTPAQSLSTPPQTEISARWPGMAPGWVDDIIASYRSESERVADLGLEDVYHRIRELVAQEVLWLSNM
jgi:nuclear pore complex protein Nup133